jgi:hypothetical protein
VRIGIAHGRRPGFAAIAVFAGVLVSVAYAALRLFAAIPPLPCFWRELLGLRCPGCGTTTALQHLMSGRLGDAFATNPLMSGLYLAGALLCLNALAGLATGRRLDAALSRAEAWAAAALFVAATAGNWVYLLLK